MIFSRSLKKALSVVTLCCLILLTVAIINSTASVAFAAPDNSLPTFSDTDNTFPDSTTLATGATAGYAPLDNRKTFTFGFDRDYAPFTFEDAHGRPTGFEIDLVKAVADHAGYNIIFKPFYWNEVQSKLSLNEIHLVSGLVKTPQRTTLFMFAEQPYYTTHLRFFTRKEDVVRNVNSFRNKTIGFEAGSLTEVILAKFHGIKQAPYKNKAEAIKALAKGDISAFIAVEHTTNWVVQKLDIQTVVATGEPVRLLDLWFATNRSHPIFLKDFNKSFRAIVDNGTYDEIYRKWFVTELSFSERTKLMQAAQKMLPNSYTPHSSKPRAAAVLCPDGSMYAAPEIEAENPAYNALSLRSAVAAAFADKKFEIRAAVLVGADGKPIEPSIADINFLYEFGRGVLIGMPSFTQDPVENILSDIVPRQAVKDLTPFTD